MKTILILLFCVFAVSSMGCKAEPPPPPFDINSIKSYSDIPGVTLDELQAIEAIKAERHNFILGVLPSSEAFVSPDGTKQGFIPMLCDLLSGLFDIQFTEEPHGMDSLLKGINDTVIDFTSEMPPTADLRQKHLVSYPIAERTLGVYTYGDSLKIESEKDLNNLRIGFLEDTTVVDSIHAAYPSLKIQPVLLKDLQEAVDALKSGRIDAFVSDTIESFSSETHELMNPYRDIFPLVYIPVSLTTANPRLAPFISVLNKYITAGGIDRLYNIYSNGSSDEAKNNFFLALTEHERAYLKDLTANNTVIPIALDYDNYPICFYNDVEHKFQGIAPEVLDRISRFTGINFKMAVDKKTSRTAVLDKLKTGEISLISELSYSRERQDDFIWSAPYSTSHYSLLSKLDFPFLKMYQVVRTSVGTVKDSAYKDVYNNLFPDDSNVKYFDSQEQAVKAFESGQTDLLMASENSLLSLMNFGERSGYKVNIRINAPLQESCFGFGKNQELLCSVITKALYYVNTDQIEKDWKSRVYDYSRKIANERSVYLFISVAALFVALVFLLVYIRKNNRSHGMYKKQMITLSAIYRALPDLVYSKDTEGIYTSCNHSFEEFIGLSEAEIIGRSPCDVYGTDIIMAYKLMAMDRKVLKEATVTRSEEWLMYPDRTRKLFEIEKVPLLHDGKVTGVLGRNRDITIYREAEKAAQEASRAKTNFLAKMSHEIRTPMNAIIGMAELALRENTVAEAHKHILTVKQAGVHLLSIINDILDFSKIEMGKFEILPGDYSFSSLINDAISIIRMRVLDSSIRFAVNIDSKIPNALFGDETRIRQVILNILNNAIKYTDKGFVLFTVLGEKVDDTTIKIVMEVKDSGRGIQEKDLKKLFGEYIQIDQEKNKGIEGVGLGLAITWNILKAMGGDIGVKSEYGSGSTFTITLPQKIRSPEPLASVENPGEKTIIIYERREIYANSIIHTIDNLGVPCTLVSDDAALTEKLSQQSYKFIFISFILLEKNRSMISRLAPTAKIVVLSEFGEAIPDKKLSVLAMPVYSTSIANILNGVADSFGFSGNNGYIVRFTSPDSRILIVDDVNTNLKVAEGLLLPYKMKIDLCNNGKEAIAIMKTNKYDLVFMDHKMPEMDGIEATKYIRALGDKDPYYRDVPMIILTANAVSGTREMFLENGFNDFLSKPIDTVKLNQILEKWLPKEKQRSIAEEIIPPLQTVQEETGKEIEIRNVNIARGIFHAGGKLENFMEILAIYYDDCLKKIDELNACRAEGNLPLYTIHVHALKSASANIGADKLSEAARVLEAAGEKGDAEFINTRHDQLVADLNSLLKDIRDVRDANRSKSKEAASTFDMEKLKPDLAMLKKALNDLDAGTMNNTIENLRKFSSPEEISAIIDSISEKILLGEYEEAAALIEPLL